MKSLRLRQLLLLSCLALVPSIAAAQSVVEVPEPYENPEARQEYFFHLRSYPFGEIPQGARMEAMEFSRKKMRQFGEGKNPTLEFNSWQQRGPYDLGGRIHSIAVHPTDGKTLWVGAADGGVWKSTNRGDSWIPVMDFENAISMGGLAVDPSNPDIIYAGTGEPVSANGDTYNGAGLMKSTDGGATWRTIGLTNVGSITTVLVHPTNGNIIVVGGNRNNAGVYRTEDGGINWTRTSSLAVADMSMNRQNPNEILVATFTKGVYRSVDGGKTFADANSGLAVGATKGRASVQFAQSNPTVAYAVLEETVGNTNLARIYKSANGGASWSKVFDSQGTGQNFFSNSVQTQGYYDNVLAVSPGNENIVVVGGVSLMRTVNGGSNWSSVGSGSVHADHHAMAFDPANPDIFYNGNDGGMYRSENAGASYRKITKGLAITQFYALALDQTRDSLAYGGTQDNGTVTSNATNAGNVLGGDGFYVVVDPNDPNVIYAENPYGENITLFINGSPFTVTAGLPIGSATNDAAWAAPLVIDPNNSSVIYNGRNRVYASLNAGSPTMSWLAISPEVRGFVSAIGVSPANSDIIYAGSDRGTVIVSTNGGEDWSDVSYGHGLPNRAVMDFALSPTEAGTAYAAYAGFYTSHIFKTTDYGQNWTDVGKGLPDIPFNALVVDPKNSDIVYAGSDVGMFISLDAGATWAVYSNGLPRTEVRDMEVNAKTGKLWIATHGRSMWEIPLETEATVPPTITAPAGGEVWTGGTGQVIGWNGFTEPVRIDYSFDNGTTWNRLKNLVGGNAFRWIVFDTTVMEARIRVTSAFDPSQVATSRSFSIEKFRLGTVLGATGVPGVPYGIAFDGEYLWATNFEGSTLLKIDPSTLSTVDEVQLNLTNGDSLFTDITYYPPRGTFFIHKLNSTTVNDPGGLLYEVTKDGQQVGIWASPFKYPIGLAWLGARNNDNPYLYMSDRNGTQPMWLIDPSTLTSGSQLAPLIQFTRANQVQYGPRGAAAGLDGSSIWQVITDFTGEVLNAATAYKFAIEESQPRSCEIGLTAAATSGYINARGIELDPRDSNLWVSDYAGSIYKLSSCDYVLNIPPPDTPTDVPDAPTVAGVTLSQNVPNPFNSSTDITFTVPEAVQGRLVVHDMSGRQVETIADGKFEAGTHTVRFEPKGLPSGVYRYVLLVDNRPVVSKKMVYVR